MNKKISLFLGIFFLHINNVLWAWVQTWASNRQDAKNDLASTFNADFIINIALSLLSIWLTVFVAKFARNKLSSLLSNSLWGDNSSDIAEFILRTVNIIIWTIWFSITLTLLGFDLWFLMWWIGLWIGFTLRAFLWNFISWLIIILWWEYKTWDIIEYNWRSWVIKKIYSLFTKVEQFNKVVYYIPNSKFMEDVIIILSSNPHRRMDIEFSVEPWTDLVKLKTLVWKIAESYPWVLDSIKSNVSIDKLTESWIQVRAMFWVKTEDNFLINKSNLTETINLALPKAWIKLVKNNMYIEEQK